MTHSGWAQVDELQGNFFVLSLYVGIHVEAHMGHEGLERK